MFKNLLLKLAMAAGFLAYIIEQAFTNIIVPIVIFLAVVGALSAVLKVMYWVLFVWNY